MKVIKNIFFVICIFLINNTYAQQSPRPKLVVGVVVDQMNYDMLYRYWNNFGENGFKRLVKDGYSCENTHYNYIPTYTGPGHASIYTGSVPAIHGIVSNNWFDKYNNNGWYCAQDTTVTGVGTTSMMGQMSPRNMLTTTITDQLKLALGEEAKVVGVALKDRGAILPAGHAADAAYWFDGYTNAWVTSSYYMDELPTWVTAINDSKPANRLMTENWNMFLDKTQYTNSTADDVSWERTFLGESAPVFPHMTENTTNMEQIKGTPHGNTLTVDFAIAALKSEKMGKDRITDFLCLSFSSTDYVGHAYGPYSVEVEDTYVRLDRELEKLLSTLDAEVGNGEYLIFLSSDHGVAPTPGYMQSLNIPAGLLNDSLLVIEMEATCDSLIGPDEWILQYSNQQIFLNRNTLKEHDIDEEEIADILAKEWAGKKEGIARVISTDEINETTIPEVYRNMFSNGIYPNRCGDILVIYDPNWIEYGPTGSTHGSHYAYDTQVPLLWYGWKISAGKTWKRTNITDIAPTIAAMLRIPQPNGCIGDVIEEMK